MIDLYITCTFIQHLTYSHQSQWSTRIIYDPFADRHGFRTFSNKLWIVFGFAIGKQGNGRVDHLTQRMIMRPSPINAALILVCFINVARKWYKSPQVSHR